jgi:sterol desaturase/sphingolipid hydroxylase (fatty acid hydroxylase superfamily)
MLTRMPQILPQLLSAACVLGLCWAVFGGLGRLFACNPDQKLFVSRAIGLDLGYCLLGVLYAGVGPAVVVAASATPWRIDALAGAGAWVQALPLGWQLLLLLVATDLFQYWLHRAFHGRLLWPFHAIHHGAEEVNWTTTFRVHPINYLMLNTSLAVLAKLMGFSELCLLLAAPIFFFSGALVHANLNWTYGPLRYVFASPVFHRWHHVADLECRDANFAPMFPVWDLAFGTFHMPRDVSPAGYGAEGVPADLLGQLVHPFRRGVRSPLPDAGLNRSPK